MSDDVEVLLLAAAGVGLAWWYFGDPEEGGVLGEARQLVTDAINGLVAKGARLTRVPYDKTTGIVNADPQALADSTTYDLETYALARAIASEEGDGSDFLQLCVGWAIKNRADAGSGSIATLVTKAKYAPHSGFFGTQRNIEQGTPGYNASDRYCATGLDPYDGHAQIALAIQNGTFADPTGGAQYFDRPAHDDNAEKTAANRAQDGLVIAEIDGLPSSIRFWRPA